MRGDDGMSFIKRSGLPPGRVPEERASVSPTLDSIGNHSRNATIGHRRNASENPHALYLSMNPGFGRRCNRVS